MLRKGKPLSIMAPAVAAEADGWDPSAVASGSSKKLPWRCPKGHTWEAIVHNRVRKGVGCPFCAGYRALPGFNDLGTVNPALAEQADGWDPSTVTAGSGSKKAWRCAEGHQWKATVNSRNQVAGCPYCGGQRTIAGENDFGTTYPALASEAVDWDPTTVRHGGNERVRWCCPKGHEYLLSVSARVRGSGCTVCASRVVIAGVNDVASQYPELVEQSISIDLTTCTPGSRRRGTWRCPRGHEYQANVADKVRGRGCPVCSNYLVVPGVNDLATTHPHVAHQASGWDPATVTAGHTKLLPWACDRGHTWETPPAQRLRGAGQGCPYCSSHGCCPASTT